MTRTRCFRLPSMSLSDAERPFLSRSAVRGRQKGEYRLAEVAPLALRAAAGARAGVGEIIARSP